MRRRLADATFWVVAVGATAASTLVVDALPDRTPRTTSMLVLLGLAVITLVLLGTTHALTSKRPDVQRDVQDVGAPPPFAAYYADERIPRLWQEAVLVVAEHVGLRPPSSITQQLRAVRESTTTIHNVPRFEDRMRDDQDLLAKSSEIAKSLNGRLVG